jgi:hypothetical protein
MSDRQSVMTVGSLPCGCVPHATRMRDNSLGQPLWCDTEQQAYCNFECPHENDDGLDDDRYRVVSEKHGLVWTGNDADEAEDIALSVAVNTARTVHLQDGTSN